MGSLLPSINPEFKRSANVLLDGPESSGKTTILYRLKLGEVATTTPILEIVTEESIEHNNICFTLSEFTLRQKALHRPRYSFQAVIFVIDAADEQRLPAAAEELHKLLKTEGFFDVPLLIYANKSELPNALPIEELEELLELHSINQRWHIQAACALSGAGLLEGLDWLAADFST